MEIEKTRSATSSKYHNSHKMSEERLWREQVTRQAIGSFQDAYLLAQQNRSLMQNYLMQTHKFVNLVAFAPGTNHISDHLACFNAPEDCTDLDAINIPLLDPIRQTQKMLAMIIFNRDGSYKGFTSCLDHKLWASIVTEYLKNYFHYNDSETFLKSMLTLKNRSVPGFTEAYDHLEESCEYKTQREALRVKAKYIIQFGPDRNRNQFNRDLIRYEALLRDRKFVEAEKILLAYTSQNDQSRYQHKVHSKRLKTMKKIATSSPDIFNDYLTASNRLDETLYDLLAIDQTLEQLLKMVSKVDATKLQYFEARQNELLQETQDISRKTCIACETAFALDLLIAHESNLFTNNKAHTPSKYNLEYTIDSRALGALKLVNSIDRLIDYLDIHFRLSQRAVNEALVLIESQVLPLYPQAFPQLIKRLERNFHSLKEFFIKKEKEYGNQKKILKIAYFNNLFIASSDYSPEEIHKALIKKIADRITLKIACKDHSFNAGMPYCQPATEITTKSSGTSMDFSNLSQIVQLLQDITSNNEALGAYIDSEIDSLELASAFVILVEKLNKLSSIICRTRKPMHDILAQEISSRIRQLRSDITNFQQNYLQPIDNPIADTDGCDEKLITLLEQNRIQEAEYIILKEGQHSLIQKYIENVSNIEAFMLSALEKTKIRNPEKRPKIIAGFFTESQIDKALVESIALRLKTHTSLEYNSIRAVSQKGIETAYQYLADILIIKTLTAIVTQACTPRAASSSSSN